MFVSEKNTQDSSILNGNVGKGAIILSIVYWGVEKKKPSGKGAETGK